MGSLDLCALLNHSSVHHQPGSLCGTLANPPSAGQRTAGCSGPLFLAAMLLSPQHRAMWSQLWGDVLKSYHEVSQICDFLALASPLHLQLFVSSEEWKQVIPIVLSSSKISWASLGGPQIHSTVPGHSRIQMWSPPLRDLQSRFSYLTNGGEGAGNRCQINVSGKGVILRDH